MADIIPFARPEPKAPGIALDPDLAEVIRQASCLLDDEILYLYNDFIGARINNILIAAGRKPRLPNRITCPTWPYDQQG
jgi:hypothetical protein